MEIQQQQKFVYWLFADDLDKKGSSFEITSYDDKHTTKKNKIIPVFSVVGVNGRGKAGDFYVSSWNILNLNELLKKWTTNSDAWVGKRINIIPVGNRMKIEELQ